MHGGGSLERSAPSPAQRKAHSGPKASQSEPRQSILCGTAACSVRWWCVCVLKGTAVGQIILPKHPESRRRQKMMPPNACTSPSQPVHSIPIRIVHILFRDLARRANASLAPRAARRVPLGGGSPGLRLHSEDAPAFESTSSMVAIPWGTQKRDLLRLCLCLRV